ncbi:MAG: acyltransferase [Proteobacteria bacterium]|nr:acyltransferase [Pseudomonadota bacterium]
MFVVAGHIPGIGFFPFLPYTFHIPLFYFLSGLVFNPSTYLGYPIIFIRCRIRSLLLPYFAYNIIFASITAGCKVWPGISFESQRWNVARMLFVEPFISGHQYMLFAPGWFLCSLFLVGLAYLFIARMLERFLVREPLRFFFFCTLAVVGMEYGRLAPESKFFNHYLNMVIAKNLIGLFFFYLGGRFREVANLACLRDSRIMVLAIAVQIYCITHYAANFSTAMNNYPSIPSSLLTSLCGITFVIFVSTRLAHSDQARDGWLISIGEQSLHVLACHLFVFHLLNIMFLAWHGESLQILSREFYYVYDPQRFWLVYLCAGIGVPTVLAIWANRLRGVLVPR